MSPIVVSSIEEIALLMDARHVRSLRVQLDCIFKTTDAVCPRVLFDDETTKYIFTYGYSSFVEKLDACFKTGRINGYQLDGDGLIRRDDLQSKLKTQRDAAHNKTTYDAKTAELEQELDQVYQWLRAWQDWAAKLVPIKNGLPDDTWARQEIEKRFRKNTKDKSK